MTLHARTPPNPYPHPLHCGQCAVCDALVDERLAELEVHLEMLSSQLWLFGWMPLALVAAARRATGSRAAADLVVGMVLGDDRLRSEQAKPEAWEHEIAQVRALTGVHDAGHGWLVRWVSQQVDVGEAVRVYQLTMEALSDIGCGQHAA